MQRKRDEFEPYVEGPWDDYVAALTNASSWGDELTLQASAERGAPSAVTSSDEHYYLMYGTPAPSPGPFSPRGRRGARGPPSATASSPTRRPSTASSAEPVPPGGFSTNGGEPVQLCTFYQDEAEDNGIDADGDEIEDYDFYSPRYWKREINDDALDAFKKHLAKDDPLLKPGALKDLVCQFCFDHAQDRRKGYLYNRNFDLMHPGSPLSSNALSDDRWPYN
ncbi:thiol-dependent ubiquitin-specific protease [Aureococcus anophagefferens]|nr:thiol-dependent ubiquitin-specific protease [Aureococcus anophagefferens]